jgi:hypothetical protein
MEADGTSKHAVWTSRAGCGRERLGEGLVQYGQDGSRRKIDTIRTALTQRSFQYIIRLLNTNVDGKQKVMYALTKIKGVGRRYSNLVCKKADVDLSKRAGDLTSEELERIVTIIQNPSQCMPRSRLCLLLDD